MLNPLERREAYRAIKEHYNLRANQRDMLDASPKLDEMLEFAHANRWRAVEPLIQDIIAARIDLPVYPA